MTNEEMMKNIEKIQQMLDVGELLCQLAEECSELAQAALKLRRVLDRVNPTPVTYDEAIESLYEEAADVTGCLAVLDIEVSDLAADQARKFKRWAKRLEGR